MRVKHLWYTYKIHIVGTYPLYISGDFLHVHFKNDIPDHVLFYSLSVQELPINISFYISGCVSVLVYMCLSVCLCMRMYMFVCVCVCARMTCKATLWSVWSLKSLYCREQTEAQVPPMRRRLHSKNTCCLLVCKSKMLTKMYPSWTLTNVGNVLSICL